MVHGDEMTASAALYREYLPSPALRPYVSRLFSFVVPGDDEGAPASLLSETRFGPGDAFCSPLFADGHASIVFAFGGYRIETLWNASRDGSGHLIGPMTSPHATFLGGRLNQIGAYLRPGALRSICHVPGSEVVNQVLSLDRCWGPVVSRIEQQLEEAPDEGHRVGLLEAALLGSRHPGWGSLDLVSIATEIQIQGGQVRIGQLAEAAGISRQHLTRAFRAEVGVSPKTYAQLVRFRTALAAGSSGRFGLEDSTWAVIAAQTGYADQSHLIAEIKRFTGLTPQSLSARGGFHPFTHLP